MRSMTISEFHDLIVTYISQISKRVDLSDPDTIIYTPEFDDLLRHIQSRPNSKLKLTYNREDPLIKLLYKQLDSLTKNKNTIRIM